MNNNELIEKMCETYNTVRFASYGKYQSVGKPENDRAGMCAALKLLSENVTPEMQVAYEQFLNLRSDVHTRRQAIAAAICKVTEIS